MTTHAPAPQALRQAAYWDQADTDGIVRRTYRAAGHCCPLCESELEAALEDHDLFSGWTLGFELACDSCGAVYAIANSDPLELMLTAKPDGRGGTRFHKEIHTVEHRDGREVHVFDFTDPGTARGNCPGPTGEPIRGTLGLPTREEP